MLVKEATANTLVMRNYRGIISCSNLSQLHRHFLVYTQIFWEMHIIEQESVQIIEVKWLELRLMYVNIWDFYRSLYFRYAYRVLYPGSNNDSCAFDAGIILPSSYLGHHNWLTLYGPR